MRIKYTLKRWLKNPRFYLYSISILIILSVMISFSLALFTANIEKESALNITTGNLYSLIEGTGINDNVIKVQPGSTYLDLKLTNVNSRDAKFNLYYSATSEQVIAYYDINYVIPERSGMVLDQYGNDDSITIKVRIDNNTGVEQTLTFGSDVGFHNKELIFPSDKKELTLDYGSCFRFIQNTVTDYHSSCPKEVVIPATINNEDVLAVGNSAFMDEGITSVVFPAGLQTIGSTSFSGNNLTSVVLPTTIKTIGTSAFKDNQITTVNLPSSITSMGATAFNNNQLPDNQAFVYGRDSSGNPTTEIVSYAGARRSTISIPSGTTIIGTNSFMALEITSVTIPSGVITIKDSSFQGNKLTTLNIPSSVTRIETEAFFQNQISSYTGGQFVTFMGYAVFNDNQLPDSQAFIYARNSDGTEDKTILKSYGGAKRSNVIVPGTIDLIDISAFQDCSITSVTLQEGIERIQYGAFRRNELTSIHLPSSITILHSHAFSSNNISTLTSVNDFNDISKNAGVFNNNQLPDNQAFIYNSSDPSTLLSYGGAKRDNVVMPNQFTRVENQALNLSMINSITLSENLVYIGSQSFNNNNLTTIDIPSSVTEIGYAAFSNNQLIDEDAIIYARNSDGTIDYTTIVSYGGARQDNVVIPEGVTTLNYRAFAYGGIYNITLPSTLVTIGKEAFYANIFTEVTLPSSVMNIDVNAFNIATAHRLEITVDGKNSTSDFTSLGSSWQGSVGMVIWNP